jgi:hypothetical protein
MCAVGRRKSHIMRKSDYQGDIMRTTKEFLHQVAQTPDASIKVLANCRRTDTSEAIERHTPHPIVKVLARERTIELRDSILLDHFRYGMPAPIHE